MINLKGEEGRVAVFPLLHTASTDPCEEFGGFCSPLFFKRRVPWSEHPVRVFSKKGHNHL